VNALDLTVSDFIDERHWRWQLSEPTGAYLADHQVSLDLDTSEYAGFVDLYRHLRWRADPERRAESERKILEQVGLWIGEHVLGAVGPAVLHAGTPTTIHVKLPPPAVALLHRPLELGIIAGKPLALQDVSFVFQVVGEGSNGRKEPVRGRLRMLAAFSLPTDASALALRRERHELNSLIRRIAATHGRDIELRILQYGVTREAFREVVEEGEGWDLIHFSGHGLPAGLLLEKADGSRDPVAGPELAQLLRAARARLKFILLSSCDSAAATAEETLRWLGLRPHRSEDLDQKEERPLASLARQLVSTLDCSVLAMRYPVMDDFAILHAAHFYESVLGKGHSLCRAEQLALVKAAGEWPRSDISPLSIATPAFFGSSSLHVSLAPPVIQAKKYSVAQTGLAHFPPEREVFVGRVGALVRASAAFAPQSGEVGVLFHGMAGAGKTACALELAYSYERGRAGNGRFQAFVWHQAPAEDHDIAGALSNFVADLEKQLPDFKMIHVLQDLEELRNFLPKLAELFRDNAILLVLDNIESLLTEDGAWRDPRWELIAQAMCGHGGLSRVILTSRRRPRGLDSHVVVEPINALSLTESVLLARQLPNLGRLMTHLDGADESHGRELVTRTLRVVQGNPELITLADRQASDPSVLEERLSDSETAWIDQYPQLDRFFSEGESSQQAERFIAVLKRWTQSAAQALPDDARFLFYFLCCLEETDRTEGMVEDVWPFLRERLNSPSSTAFHEPLRVLVDQGLIETEKGDTLEGVYYRIHPAVGAAGQDHAGPVFRSSVDGLMGELWDNVLAQTAGGSDAELGDVIRSGGQRAVPYLIRRGELAKAAEVIGKVLMRDDSPQVVGAVLPILQELATRAAGTEAELGIRGYLAKALISARPAVAEDHLRILLRDAVERGRFVNASAVAADLFQVLILEDRYKEALALVEKKREYTKLAKLGPMTQLSDDVRRLQVLTQMGRSTEVLAEVQGLLSRLDSLPPGTQGTEIVERWKGREALLDCAQRAATSLERWQEALDFNSLLIQSARARRAPTAMLVGYVFFGYGPMLRLGHYDEARQLVLECQRSFEEARDFARLGQAFAALALLANERERREEAIEFQERALRYGYSQERSEWSALSHRHRTLATYLNAAGRDDALAVAHWLAGEMIAAAAGVDEAAIIFERVGRYLSVAPKTAEMPTTFDAVCAYVEQTEGTRFRQAIDQLVSAPASADQLLERILLGARLVQDGTMEKAIQDLVEKWEANIETITSAVLGDSRSVTSVGSFLDGLSEQEEWAELSHVIRRVIAGERGSDLMDHLELWDRAIVGALLRRIADRSALHEEGEQAVVKLVVGLARREEWATKMGHNYLAQLDATYDGRPLAAAIRRIVSGDRNANLLAGLDESDAIQVKAALRELEADQSVTRPVPASD